MTAAIYALPPRRCVLTSVKFGLTPWLKLLRIAIAPEEEEMGSGNKDLSLLQIK